VALTRRYRTIREEPSFRECVERLGGGWKRTDDILGNLRWKLSRDPVAYSFQLANRTTRVTFTEQLGSAPALRVFFWLEGDTVVLAWMEEADETIPTGFDDWLG